jgi:hypothetical protein
MKHMGVDRKRDARLRISVLEIVAMSTFRHANARDNFTPVKKTGAGPQRVPVTAKHDQGVARLQLIEHTFEFGPADDTADHILLLLGGCPVRKFVRIAFIVCLAVAAAPVVLLGSLWLGAWVKFESFYQKMPLLREMRAVQRDKTYDSAPAREVLLQRLPLGTDREAAVAGLRSEGFDCSINDQIDQDFTRQNFVKAGHSTSNPNDDRSNKDYEHCLVNAPRFGMTEALDILSPLFMGPNDVGTTYGQNWFVDLEFNAEGHLSDALISVTNKGPRLW